MSTGFRKSLFGFNSQDVIEYIDRTHKSFSKKEIQLNSKIDELSALLEESKQEQKKLELEKLELDNRLNAFTEKYEEIERLCENIGKLYLVAQNNAQAIMRNAEEESQAVEQEVNKNLYSIDEAHKTLTALREEIIQTSDNFSQKVESLISSLSDAREKITSDYNDSVKHKENFDKIYNSIVK
ncbi:MAG: hypothetical protein IJD71_06350 [Clostridia bacterium]|nr:hypothetical protein [Clostridia bacterium]